MLTNDQIKAQVEQALQARSPRNVLMVVPDFTRFFSNAGLIANLAYHWCMKNGAKVQILEALGTHVPMTEAQVKEMYGDIPFSIFHGHDWRKDVVKIG
ncbi:MAG: lactate racemase domain-containing protein, partial [Sphaerochaetaceae bacterium]